MNAITPVTPTEYQMTVSMAQTLFKSQLLPRDVNTVEKAIAIILAGRELGVAPWQAISTINVISGKPTISPQLMLALVRRSGQLENIEINGDNTQCTVTVKRRGEAAYTEAFTFQDATALGLAGKDNYRKQPKVMLRWRCVAAALRITFPDVILGMYTPEEMGAEVSVSDDGEMTVVAPPQKQLPPTVVADEEQPQQAQGATQPPPQAQSSNAVDLDAKFPRKHDVVAWTDAEIKQFAKQYTDASISHKEALQALNVSRFGEWKGTLKDAQDALDAFIAKQLGVIEEAVPA